MPRSRKAGPLLDFVPDHEILNLVAGLDEFKGLWRSIARELPARQLATLGSRATVESVGASTRMDGGRMTDAEIDRFLFGPDPRAPSSRNERTVAGYAEALEMVYDVVGGEGLDSGFIRRLHGIVTWYSDAAGAERGEYRKVPMKVRAYDAGGRPANTLLQAAPPGRVGSLVEEIVGWTSAALDSGEYHPLLVTAAFTVQFRVIHPFTEGSGRLARLLATWMLVRSGYTHMPYASIERVLEESRAHHHRALSRAGGLLKGDTSGLREWTIFFLRLLAAQREELMRRLDRQHRRTRLPELSVQILDLARGSGRLTMARAIEETGANRNTIKVHLRQLVAQGRLVRHGAGRGTWYTPS